VCKTSERATEKIMADYFVIIATPFVDFSSFSPLDRHRDAINLKAINIIICSDYWSCFLFKKNSYFSIQIKGDDDNDGRVVKIFLMPFVLTKM
jgi:hypothetical protein